MKKGREDLADVLEDENREMEDQIQNAVRLSRAILDLAQAFGIASDDGSRLWVNGQLVVDNWGNHGMRTVDSSKIKLDGISPGVFDTINWFCENIFNSIGKS